MLAKIKDIVDKDIRPLLTSHGGDVEIVELTADSYVKIRLLGACSSCPGQQQTLESLIETVLQEQMPEINGVVLEQQVSPDLIDQALRIIRGGQRT